MNSHNPRRTRPPFQGAPPARQKGISIVLITIALVALIGMSGLALDGGHLMLNKTRLQNTVDAAALSAAKVVDQTLGDIDAGRQAALDTFGDNAAGSGNQELADAYGNGAGDINITVQFSSVLDPFTPGSPTGPYVRVIATDFLLPVFLSRVVGFADKRVAASAVAGPSPTLDEACNIAPVLVCGDPEAPSFGLAPGQLEALKLEAGTNDGTSQQCEVGPGNYHLVRLGGSGGSVVRDNLAGGYEGCITLGDEIETEPGVKTGPVHQGFNTRFGMYSGPVSQADYPPDVVVFGTHSGAPPLEPDDNGTRDDRCDDFVSQDGQRVDLGSDTSFSFADYQARITAENFDFEPEPGPGRFGRRVLAVPVADCTAEEQGQSTLPLLGFACFFMLQPVEQGGGQDSYLIGEFVGACDAGGSPGPNPNSGPGPHVIQLYNDPDSVDS